MTLDHIARKPRLRISRVLFPALLLAVCAFPALAQLTITTTSPLKDATETGFYSVQFTATGGSGGNNWSSAGVLPSGLTLDSATGLFSGIVAAGAAGPYSFSVTVIDDKQDIATSQFSMTVNQAPVITTTTLQNGTVNTPYSQGVTVQFGTPPYSWNTLETQLPAGLGLDSATCGSGAATCLIVGIPTATGTTNFSIGLNDSNTAFASQNLSITINPFPQITTTSLPTGTVGVNYPPTTLTAIGGTPPLTWSVGPGAPPLPAGLSLNSLTGQITGTPTTPGTTTSNFVVTDVNGAVAAKLLSITIDSPISITNTSPLPNGTVGVNYSQTLTATGGNGNFNWSVTVGTLPGGLTLNSVTGLISGSPTTPGTSNFTVQVADTTGATATKAFALTIISPLTITTTSPLPTGTAALAYTVTLAASGGTGGNTWSVLSGTLPGGLSLNTATGQISGVPNQPGTANFTIQVIDSSQDTANKAFALTIDPPLSITNTSPLPTGTVGAAYSVTMLATGGSGTYTWSGNTGLPGGLSLNSSSGVISGTPTTAGTFNPTIQVTDTLGVSAAKPFVLVISAALQITTASPLPTGTAGINYSQTLAATGGTAPLSWSITAGALPGGLALNSATGQISGNPAAAVANFTVQVSDINGATTTKAFALTINAAPVITTASPLPPGTQGTNYNQTLAVSGGTSPFTWTVTSGALPAGVSLGSATGQLSGIPTANGQFNFTIQVADVNGATNSKPFALLINPGIGITTASPLPSGTVGASYSVTLQETGGTPAFFWSVSVGALPAGLALNSSTGVISGTPTTVGTANFTILLSDSAEASTTKAFALTINSAPSITTTSLPPGTVGVNYSQTLAVSGGTAPFQWSITSGALPAGLALNSTTGQISGVPTAVGTANFTVQVADVNHSAATKAFALTINSTLVITTSSPLVSGVVGVNYSQTLTATGGSGSYTWAVSAGSLPAGLSLNSATGQISGTPGAAGAFNFTIQVVDSNQVTAVKAFVLNVNVVLTITSTSPLASGAVGVAYSQTLTATGGFPPYTWGITQGGLPSGLILNPSGQITGTPTAASSQRFTVQVTDSQKFTASATFVLTINEALVITTKSPLPPGTLNTAYSQTLSATGGAVPFTWKVTLGALPAGLSLSSSGQITGTPTATGTANFTVQVTDANAVSASAPFALTINSGLTITTLTLPNGTVGVVYAQTLAASGGAAPLNWTVTSGALPAGLSLNSTTGQIAGTPTAAGAANFTVQVTDNNGATNSRPFTLTINPPLTITTTSPLPGGTANVAYSTMLAASGGTPGYTWSVSAGTLPGGLLLDSASGQISGKPVAGGTSTFTIQVKDSTGLTASAPFSLTVAANPAIIPTTLPVPTLGGSYNFKLTASGPGAPFTWAITAGALPGGLTLDSTTGVLSGTVTAVGTFTFTVTVTDSAQNTATQSFTLVVAAVPATVNIQGLPTSSPPQQQLTVSVVLAETYPVDLNGTLSVAFTPATSTPVDDPAIQFVGGGRSVPFQVCAGQTSPVFPPQVCPSAPNAAPGVQTGTVQGSLLFTVSLTAGGLPVTLTNTPDVTVSLPPSVPVINTVTIVPVSSGFNIQVNGFSNDREITEADFHFTAAPGSTLQTADFTPTGVSDAFQTWFTSAASDVFGSTFQYLQPFTITTGTVSTLQSVTVTLKNAQGASATMTATF